MLYACSKCFTRHPFEELSQGQQLCKVKILILFNNMFISEKFEISSASQNKDKLFVKRLDMI